MGSFLNEFAEGEPLFADITAGEALRTLRMILTELDIKNGSEYRTHDLRRGHARDLQQSGTMFLLTCTVVQFVLWKRSPPL